MCAGAARQKVQPIGPPQAPKPVSGTAGPACPIYIHHSHCCFADDATALVDRTTTSVRVDRSKSWWIGSSTQRGARGQQCSIDYSERSAHPSCGRESCSEEKRLAGSERRAGGAVAKRTNRRLDRLEGTLCAKALLPTHIPWQRWLDWHRWLRRRAGPG